jgi:hypothetical protein
MWGRAGIRSLAGLSCVVTKAATTESETQQESYVPSVDFPPKEIQGDNNSVATWFKQVFSAVAQKKTDPTMTARESELYALSATEYVEARKENKVSCEEYARALVKRARYYRYLNQWVYNNYDLFDKVVEQAIELDRKASADGVEAIAPFYGLPIPMKGTAAVVDYPSGSGSGILSAYTPVRDSNLTQLIQRRGGIIFGTTNVRCN